MDLQLCRDIVHVVYTIKTFQQSLKMTIDATTMEWVKQVYIEKKVSQ